MKRIAMALAAGVTGLAISISFGVPSTYAAAKTKVDCDAVMKEISGGKKPKQVAKDMSISASSVYRCRKKEMAAAKTSAKAGNEPAKSAPATAPKP